MDETDRRELAGVFDEATLQRLESMVKALPAQAERLESSGIETLDEAATHLCAEMERKSSRARDLILRQPPKQLLGYVWSRHYLNIIGELDEQGDSHRPDKQMIDDIQFLLEFAHAAWSCSTERVDDRSKLNEAEVVELFDTLAELRNTTLLYCMMKARMVAVEAQDPRRGNLAFRAMASWVNLRGRRYQVLEDEFLNFVLSPHDEALRNCYGMGANDIAAGVQAIANSTRTGLSDAFARIERGMKAAQPRDGIEGVSHEITTELRESVDDLFNGGICNLSRHTNLARPLLEDLSYSPGENTEFLAEGELRGTPLRTLPALVKPGIRLGDDYYITDGQFVRDVAYRCIQRGLLARDRSYREVWNRRQKTAVEDAFTEIFASQLNGALAHHSVFFREPKTGNWVETDLVVLVEDVLVVIEAKAGVMAMESPAADFDRHMASVERLIVSAYRQCERFLDYLASAKTVPIYTLRRGRHVKVADLGLDAFRRVLPIGLTVESLSPFSTCLNNLDEISPLLEKHGFMSMSVDDLLVLSRFLPTAGELFHYLEVRQQAGVVPDTMLLDETEYLGAYISRNRFDADLREQRVDAPFVLWNSFANVVDQYFEGENAGRGRVPQQSYPPELLAVLGVLDRKRPDGWLDMDAAIRNLGTEDRDNLSKSMAGLKATLGRYDYRRMLMFDGVPLQVWVCASGRSPQQDEVRRQAEVACVLASAPKTRVLRLSYNKKGRLTSAACTSYAAPRKSRSDYPDLEREAAAQRARAVDGQSLQKAPWP